MKKADVDEHMRLVENFQSHLQALAHQQANDGDDIAAGLLLVLERRVYRATNDWRCSVDIDDADAPAPAVVKPKPHRHDYLASITRGDNPPVCACGKPKNPNGRPRKQLPVTPVKP